MRKHEERKCSRTFLPSVVLGETSYISATTALQRNQASEGWRRRSALLRRLTRPVSSPNYVIPACRSFGRCVAACGRKTCKQKVAVL